MNLLVCISKTPETTAKIAFTADNKEFNTDGVQFIMNPYDEWYSLVRAIELKEQLGSGKVVVINVGPASNDIVIRKALAIGADEAVRVNSDANTAYSVAHDIAEYAKSQDFDAVFLGKETIDYSGAEVGGMIAELLEIPFFSFVSKLEKNGDTVIVHRDIEGGEEVSEYAGKFVLSAAKGLAEQRIPNMRGIMTAKKKPLTVIEGSGVQDPVSLTTFTLPPAKTGVKMLDPDDMDELVRLLHEEAKVI